MSGAVRSTRRGAVAASKRRFFGDGSTTSTKAATSPHTAVGNGELQWEYVGGWSSNDLDHFTKVADRTATLRWKGTNADIYGTVAATNGLAEMTLDGTVIGTVDFYSSVRAEDVVVASLTGLADGNHILTFRVTGTKNASATDTFVAFTKAIVQSSGLAAPPVAAMPAFMYDKFYLGGARPTGPDKNDGLIYNTPIGVNAVFTESKLEPALAHTSDIVTPDEVWISYPNDPMGILRCTVFPVGDKAVRLPDDAAAVHDGSPNGIVAFLTEDNTAVWNGQSMKRLTLADIPEVEYLWPQTVPTTLTGTDFRGQHGGSHLSGLFGCIREVEWNEIATNPLGIRHALSINVFAAKYLRGPAQGVTQGNVWPAPDDDGYWNHDGKDGRPLNANHYGAKPVTGGIATHMRMGALLAIPSGTDLTWITHAKVKAIANALRDFGGYIVDDTYRDVHALSVEHTISSAWKGAGTTFHAELMKVFNLLRVVSNNSPTSIGGGGAFVADPPPPLS